MSGRDRGDRGALAALGLTLLAIVFVSLWGQSPSAEGVTSPSPSPIEQTEDAANGSPQFRIGIPVTIVETPEQKKAGAEREQHSKEHDARDLDAQIRAADAAEKQVFPTWAAAIFSFFGTGLIFYGLILTKRANLIAQIDKRAWVDVEVIANEAGGRSLKISNKGKSPALNVKQSFLIFGDPTGDGLQSKAISSARRDLGKLTANTFILFPDEEALIVAASSMQEGEAFNALKKAGHHPFAMVFAAYQILASREWHYSVKVYVMTDTASRIVLEEVAHARWFD